MDDENIAPPGMYGKHGDKRRHPRKTVFKSALIYPVLEEAGFAVENISHMGLSGQCALSLGLLQQVHVTFDDESFRTAEIRWIKGNKYGLLMEEPLVWNADKEIPWVEDQQPRERRLAVEISATLVASAPVLLGTVRNISLEGMMIALGSSLSEGTRLLVKIRGSDVRLGRVQWSHDGTIGIFFPSAPRLVGQSAVD